MRPKNLWIGIFVLIVLVAGVAVYVATQEEEKVTTAVPGVPPMVSAQNELPNLSITFGNQTSTKLADLQGDIMLIFFNPDCDHCHHEAEQIAAEKSAFDKWQLYFIASVDAKAAEEFGVKYKLTNPNFHFGSASVSDVYNAVGPLNEVPTILIFKDRRFVRKYEGVTPVAELKQYL